MTYEKKDVILYQIMGCLVETYGYSIVQINGQKQDLWLTNKENKKFPIIRLSAKASSSLIFEMDYLSKVKNFLQRFLSSDDDVLIINTNIESEPFVEEKFTQVLLNENNENVMLFETFPQLKEWIKDVDDNEAEITRIHADIQQFQNKKMKEYQKKANRIPKFTGAIIAICVVIFGLTMLIANMMGGISDDTSWTNALIMSGAYYKPFIVGAHEYWRFLTAGFLHMDIWHLLMNMLALNSLGSLTEKFYSKKQYLIILIVSIVVGDAVTYVISDAGLAVGISGGLYGLMAACIIYTIENGTIKIPQIRLAVTRIIMINILISMLPGIGWAAHLGGFIAGAILAFIFIDSPRWKAYKIHVEICSVILLCVLGYLGVTNGDVAEVYPATDMEVIEGYRSAGLNTYADYLETQMIELYTR